MKTLIVKMGRHHCTVAIVKKTCPALGMKWPARQDRTGILLVCLVGRILT